LGGDVRQPVNAIPSRNTAPQLALAFIRTCRL
jgi:hypothetical protein